MIPQRTEPGRVGHRLLAGAALLAALCLVTGCSKTGNVYGKITYKGKPLTMGRILFYDAQGHSVESTISEDGNYKITKAPTGTVKVAIVTPKKDPSGGGAGPGPGGMRGGPPGGRSGPPAGAAPPKGVLPEGVDPSIFDRGAKTKNAVEVPAKYGDPEKSGLTLTVSGGSQQKDWDLE